MYAVSGNPDECRLSVQQRYRIETYGKRDNTRESLRATGRICIETNLGPHNCAISQCLNSILRE